VKIGRKGMIVADSVRRTSAKSRHLLVRISPHVIVYHVIGASERTEKKNARRLIGRSFFDARKWNTRKKALTRELQRQRGNASTDVLLRTRLDHGSRCQ